MRIRPSIVALLLGVASTLAAPPYDPYIPQKPLAVKLTDNTTVTVKAIRVSTSTATQERALFIDYVPSSRSTNMWNQIVEMYDVAQHFNFLAPMEGVSKIWVTPMLFSDEIMSSKNTSYPYRVADGVASADWHLESQPWFRSDKTKS